MMTRARKTAAKSEVSFERQHSQYKSRPFAPKAEEHEVPLKESRVSLSLADIDIIPRETVQPKLTHEVQQGQDRIKSTETISGIQLNDCRNWMERQIGKAMNPITNNYVGPICTGVTQLKKDKNLDENITLLHGTKSEKFEVKSEQGVSTKDTPDPPAWFAYLEYLAKEAGGRYGNDKIYLNVYKPVAPINIFQYDFASEIFEDIRGENYLDPEIAKFLTEDQKKSFGEFTKETAQEWNNKFPEKDGYELSHDVKLNVPEVVLFDQGLRKLKRIEQKVYSKTS